VEERTAADMDYDGAPTVIRNGVPRPAGMAANPLELAAVMALGLPFAVYLLFSSASPKARLWYLTCSVLISITLVLSISRTGILAAAAILVVAVVANASRPRLVVSGLAAVAALGAVVALLVPASVDATIRQFGKDGNEDASLATRLQDYEELNNLLGPHAWVGRGPNAVETYAARDGGGLVLDNQYLLLIAETGVIGLTALILLLASTGATAARRAREPTNERGLWVAAVGAVAAFTVMSATFDIVRFAQATSLFMVVVGLVSSSELGQRPHTLAPTVAGVR
jgi:O-antigen ligase